MWNFCCCICSLLPFQYAVVHSYTQYTALIKPGEFVWNVPEQDRIVEKLVLMPTHTHRTIYENLNTQKKTISDTTETPTTVPNNGKQFLFEKQIGSTHV